MNLIGLAELAELYGVSKNTANTWARRHDWPSPVVTLKMGPVWDRDVILYHRPLTDHAQEHRIKCAWCGEETFDHNGFDPERNVDVFHCFCGEETHVFTTWNAGMVTVVACKPKEA